MHANTSPLQPGTDGPAADEQAAPAIASEAAYALAAVYLEAGRGQPDVAALARLFTAAPHMATSILAAMADLSRR